MKDDAICQNCTKITQDGVLQAAMGRLKRVRENGNRGDVNWISREYDPIWTGKPRGPSRQSDLELLAYAMIEKFYLKPEQVAADYQRDAEDNWRGD